MRPPASGMWQLERSDESGAADAEPQSISTQFVEHASASTSRDPGKFQGREQCSRGILCLTMNSMNNASARITLKSLLSGKKCSILRLNMFGNVNNSSVSNTEIAVAYHTAGMGIANSGLSNNREFYRILTRRPTQHGTSVGLDAFFGLDGAFRVSESLSTSSNSYSVSDSRQTSLIVHF